MKTLRIAAVALVSISFRLSAQVSPTSFGPVNATAYQVISADGNSCVWERTDSGDATSAPQKHSYIQLETGLNHLVNGQWVQSSENIQIMPDGTAAATNGQHQAYFPADIYESALTVITPAGQILQSRPELLIYTDGNNVQVLGYLTNSIGELAASNQVVYPNAFSGTKADIRVTYTKSGIEQDIIIRQQLAPPSSLGLDPAKTRLALMTEFFDPPAPDVSGGIADTANDIQDSNISLGGMKMIPGMAFATRDASQKITVGAAVFKEWTTLQGRTFLMEKLPYQAIAQQLQTLPLQASLAKPSNPVKLALNSSVKSILPPLRSIKPSTGAVMLAKADYNRTPGVVLDYMMLASVVGDYDFRADTTYLMTGSYFEIDGLATFEGNTVIKFASGAAGFHLSYGGISWLSSPYRPVIMTASDDDTVGEVISGSTGSPSGYYGSGITIIENNGIVLHDLRMSYLGLGFYLYVGSEFDNIQAVNCSTVILHAFAGTTINNALFYNITNVAVQASGSSTGVSGTQLTIDNVNTFADPARPL